MSTESTDLHEQFVRDGVVFAERALDDDALARAQAAFEWSVANPGPAGMHAYAGTSGAFFQDLCNPACRQSDAYRHLHEDTTIPDLVTGLWRDPEIWFMYEQVFLKDGPAARRSGWHQDSSYITVDGSHLAVVWIAFDDVPEEAAWSSSWGHTAGRSTTRRASTPTTRPRRCSRDCRGCRTSKRIGARGTSSPGRCSRAT